MLTQQVDKILADRERMREALKAAELTYQALERNYKILEDALRAKGLPSSWLGIEIAKAAKIRAALVR